MARSVARSDPAREEALRRALAACGGEDLGWDEWARAWLEGERARKGAETAVVGCIGYERAAQRLGSTADARRAEARKLAALVALTKTHRNRDDAIALLSIAVGLGSRAAKRR